MPWPVSRLVGHGLHWSVLASFGCCCLCQKSTQRGDAKRSFKFLTGDECTRAIILSGSGDHVQGTMHTHRVGDCSPDCNPNRAMRERWNALIGPSLRGMTPALLPEMCETCTAQKTGSLSRGIQPSASLSWSSVTRGYSPRKPTGSARLSVVKLEEKNTKFHLTCTRVALAQSPAPGS